MLRIDNQRARSRETKPGSDRGFSKRQRRDPVRRRKSPAGLRLGGAGLRQQHYPQRGRKARGLLRRYLEKMTGLSRAQVTRLIAHYRAHGGAPARSLPAAPLPQRYTRADIELLATVDEAHETLSGPATRRILEREYQHYGKQDYQRLASISVAHLYNLRHQSRYRHATELQQDQAHGGGDWRAAAARSARPARLSARRHRAPRR